MEGSTEFDESALTGESTPVKHQEGHQIFSGTVNIGNSSVVGKVTSLEGRFIVKSNCEYGKRWSNAQSTYGAHS